MKENQPKLLAFIESLDFVAPTVQTAQSVDRGHGRIDTRKIAVLQKTKEMDISFPYVQQIFCINRVRTGLDGMLISSEISYGITSASYQRIDAQSLLKGVRGHWCIESSDHYVKDVTLGEDACRVRQAGSAQILSIFRNLTLNMLRMLEFTNIAEGVRKFAFGPKTLALRTLGINRLEKIS